MGLSFLGPSRDRPWVRILNDITGESFVMTVEHIDALHAHIHQNDPKPKVSDSLPPWCPTVSELARARTFLRALAQKTQARYQYDNPMDECYVIGMAQAAMDALGGGPVLKDDLEVDDDPESEGRAAEDAEADQRKADR